MIIVFRQYPPHFARQRRSRKGRESTLGTLNCEHRYCPGVFSLLFEIPKEPMNHAPRQLREVTDLELQNPNRRSSAKELANVWYWQWSDIECVFPTRTDVAVHAA